MKIGIDGLGFVSPWGETFESFYTNYHARQSAIRPIDRFDTTQITAKSAALVSEFDAKKYIDPKKVRKYDTFSRFGISTAKLALQSSQVQLSAEQRENMGIVLSCESQNMVTAEYLDVLYREGADHVSPKLFSIASANSANCSIAMEIDVHGPSVNVSSHFASGFLSVYTGSQLIRAGQTDHCLVGSIDYLSQPVMECYTRMNAYKTQDSERGFVPGEGSASLVLSNQEGQYGTILGLSYICSSQKNYLWPTDSKLHAEVLKKAIGEHKIDKFQSTSNGDKIVNQLDSEAYELIFKDEAQKPEKVFIKSYLGEFSSIPIFQVISACCEPQGTKTLISVTSVGGVHGALLVISSGYKGLQNAVGF
ncbi:MAG: beta-ketoacyl synthase N-terminal-like domain-containing protein [Bdellovibrionales bacterium]